ncbi:tRNA epoxyqueuosine(34) reductase QueG [Coprobacter tertius]|uniref:tRNA epoxyqueuosine(34) reductase QueG n=1 Tax=Coprobacter tertius TaxID=2944915 RepID=A0ABT1MCW4_9BACT|nr:tRNA epoxyqueuosine(34) reductase QueG [Coprobacter tertius]MCP9610488.1 tRNA epoxyqueuosine(34) reductase QueG [Coprobacter tertius]
MDTVSKRSVNASLIKEEAFRLGFSACGIADARSVSEAYRLSLKKWLTEGCHAGMSYMENYFDKRCDLRSLVPGARSVIVVALNYYPAKRLAVDHPQFAYYAYGRDYHDIMKEKLTELLHYIRSLSFCEGRVFCDTAPIPERYWAQQAGLGFIGRNTQLILPGKGSFFFLGELVVTLPLTPDSPLKNHCGKCRRCIDACPTQALSSSEVSLDARKCISCQTIENRGPIPVEIAEHLGNRVYGCDTCQTVCPWNRFARATIIDELQPSDEFLHLDTDRLQQLTRDDFNRIFRHSAVKRAKYEGLMRNVKTIVENDGKPSRI